MIHSDEEGQRILIDVLQLKDFHDLYENELEFLDKLESNGSHYSELTQKQKQWLSRIYDKLK